MTRRRDAPPVEVDTSTRTLPYNLEAEKATLGAVLINGALLPQAFSILRASDFFRRAHQEVFTSIVNLDAQGVAVDFITVKDDLLRRDQLDEVGGPAYISSLTDGVPRTANIAYYAQIVRDDSMRRALIQAANKILVEAYDAKLSPAAVVSAADHAMISLQRNDSAGEFVSLAETVSDEYSSIEAAVENRGKLIGITSGYQSIDELTHGWQAGDLIAVCARPSIGKTALVLNMAVAASQADKHTAIFSMEMRRRQLQRRLLSHLSGVPLNLLLSGHLGENDYVKLTEGMSKYSELKISVNDRAHQTWQDIRTSCRLLKAKKQLDLVVVDYFQLMTGSLEGKQNRNEQLSDVSRNLKILADEVAAPIILLSQLNRAGAARADSRPILSDIRDTGALEQDADIVAFLHRKHHREDGLTQFIVEKQRNGAGGTINLSIRRDTQTFEDAGIELEQADLPEAPPPSEGPAKPPRGWRRRPRY
jgi:replicative DNA helicase